METIGADIVLQILQEEGVDTIFGYPGASSLPLHDRLQGSPIRHYLTRHEQAAAHAADGMPAPQEKSESACRLQDRARPTW